MNLKARLRTAIAKRNALTVDQMAQLLDCPKQVVLNLVELGRLTPLSTNPLVFSQEEAQRGKKECDRRQEALTEIIRLGEGLADMVIAAKEGVEYTADDLVGRLEGIDLHGLTAARILSNL